MLKIGNRDLYKLDLAEIGVRWICQRVAVNIQVVQFQVGRGQTGNILAGGAISRSIEYGDLLDERP